MSNNMFIFYNIYYFINIIVNNLPCCLPPISHQSPTYLPPPTVLESPILAIVFYVYTCVRAQTYSILY